VITATDLELRAGARTLLSNITVRVQPGDRIGLVGRNGAGKTTTLRALAGESLPYSGTMPDGSTFSSTGAVTISSSANNSPYSIMETEKITTKDYRVLSSADLTWTIIPGLNFKTLLSVYMDYTTGLDFAKSNSAAAGAVSKGIYNNRMYFDLLNENTFTYNKQFGDHSLDLLAGFTTQQTRVDSQQVTGLNYQSDNITTLNTALSIDQNTKNTFTNVNKIGLLSYLGRVNYSYKSKYLLSASIRSDGSSKFAPGQKYGVFPAASAGWVASNEKFLRSVNWISNLKLRGSYGATGNNNIADFGWLDVLYAANYPLNTGTGMNPLTMKYLRELQPRLEELVDAAEATAAAETETPPDLRQPASRAGDRPELIGWHAHPLQQHQQGEPPGGGTTPERMVNPGGVTFDLRKFPKDDFERFRNSVLNGKPPAMPPWRDKVGDEDLKLLWAYVRGGG